jgi:hypothetical protein
MENIKRKSALVKQNSLYPGIQNMDRNYQAFNSWRRENETLRYSVPNIGPQEAFFPNIGHGWHAECGIRIQSGIF